MRTWPLSRRTERNTTLFQLLAADRDEFLPVSDRATDLHLRARCAPEDAGHSRVGGVTAGADAHQTVQVREAGRVEHDPAAADEALDAGMEIRGLQLVCVAGKVARRNVERPAQRDAQVREVATDA